MGISAPFPLYVVRLEPESNTVVVGYRDALASRSFRANQANWQHAIEPEFVANIQIRYKHRGEPGRVRLLENNAFEAEFDAPVDAITPGQAAAIYVGDVLLGGGWIE
ncbi:TPA: hypothetical protein DDW35_01255 [Candidatus Sumerlaeota bacterium]|nr:hypothetical protein [Candidatus Sumerlaeota bacterium]